MHYMNFDKFKAIDPVAFRSTRPYPYINPRGLLTEEGYLALLDNMPDISLFEKKFGYERIAGQKPHDRYSLEYTSDTPVPRPWQERPPFAPVRVWSGLPVPGISSRL